MYNKLCLKKINYPG